MSRTHVWLHCVTRSDWWISNYSSSDSQSESRTQLSSEVKCKFLTSGMEGGGSGTAEAKHWKHWAVTPTHWNQTENWGQHCEWMCASNNANCLVENTNSWVELTAIHGPSKEKVSIILWIISFHTEKMNVYLSWVAHLYCFAEKSVVEVIVVI